MTSTIERLRVKDFTVFSDLDLPLASGINVFAGENGAGKSHLLKAMSVIHKCLPAESVKFEAGDGANEVGKFCKTSAIA
ncbi:AAA family ATPase, partial [Rathayibacter tritici]|uniref:AAA family ATPase n=1 Tax=Rathayibacter tritici TaxID=33888 RepID=UPI0015E24A65